MKRIYPGAFYFILVLTYGYLAFLYPLDFDELIQFHLLEEGHLGEILKYLNTKDRQMPLVYILLYPFVKLSNSAHMGIRLPTFVMASLAPYVFYRFCRKSIGSRAALGASALMALSYLSVRYSFSIRPYSAVLFFSCLTQLFFWDVCKATKERPAPVKSYFYFYLCGLFLALTHYFGALVAGVLFLSVYLRQQASSSFLRERPVLKYFIDAGIITTIIAGLYAIIVFPMTEHPYHLFPHWIKIALTSNGMMGSTGIIVLLLIYFFYKMFSDIKFKIRTFEIESVLLCMILPAAALVISIFHHPAYEYRFFIGALPWGIWFLVNRITLHFSSRFFTTVLIAVIALDFAFFTFKVKRVLSPRSRLNIPLILKEHKDLKNSSVTSCGNCPSFYFDKQSLKCFEGWNFSTVPKDYKATEYFLIFNTNLGFCSKYIPTEGIEFSYPGAILIRAKKPLFFP